MYNLKTSPMHLELDYPQYSQDVPQETATLQQGQED